MATSDGTRAMVVLMAKRPWRPRPWQLKYGPAFVARALELWNTGLSMKAVGIAMGVGKDVIAGIAYRHDFPGRPSPIRR